MPTPDPKAIFCYVCHEELEPVSTEWSQFGPALPNDIVQIHVCEPCGIKMRKELARHAIPFDSGKMH